MTLTAVPAGVECERERGAHPLMPVRSRAAPGQVIRIPIGTGD